jgi:hypothetical protein
LEQKTAKTGDKMKSTEEIIKRLRDRDNVHDGDVDEAADRLEELTKRIDVLEAGLQAVIKHQDFIGGGFSIYSTTRKIAEIALYGK